MDAVVKRTFDMDFLYFDLLFTTIWIALLVKRKHYKPLVFGLLGYTVNLIGDYIIWYQITGIRHIETLPIKDFVFFLYFGFTYGVVEFSYVTLMFKENTNKGFWTIFLYIGWIFNGFASQLFSIDDREIVVWRQMREDRTIQIAMVALGFLLLYLSTRKTKSTARVVPYVFLVGFLVHFAMEISLLLPGIRPQSLDVLLFNSFLEFNSGAPYLYLMWWYWEQKNHQTPANSFFKKKLGKPVIQNAPVSEMNRIS